MAKIKIKNWEQAAKFCEETFGSYVDWEERFFHCPECDEPIYECDWDKYDDWEACPVYELTWENVE